MFAVGDTGYMRYTVIISPPHCDCGRPKTCKHFKAAKAKAGPNFEKPSSMLIWNSRQVDRNGRRRAAMTEFGFGPLPSSDLYYERQELIFQRDMNGMRYISWERIRGFVELHGSYEVSDGVGKEEMNGRKILECARRRIKNVSRSGILCIRRLTEGETVPVSARWSMSGRHDKDGRELVLCHGMDVWDFNDLITDVTGSDLLKYGPDNETLDTVVDTIVDYRRTVRRLHDCGALEAARKPTTDVVRSLLAAEMLKGRPLESALSIAMLRGTEALDRAYGYERIRKAGIDLDCHPEFRSYQAFYDLDMPPPTHQEMADCIIRLFASSVADCARRDGGGRT